MSARRHPAFRSAAFPAAALLTLLLASGAAAQFNVSGQASSAFLKSGNALTQYSLNQGRATFAWRLDLFLDAEISSDVVLLGNVRVAQDQRWYVDLFAIRWTGIAGSLLNAEAGLIDVPFGNLGERRFPWGNPFIALPLPREHRTALRSTDYGLDDPPTTAPYGVRLIDGPLYDAGLKLFGSTGIISWAAAVTNGAVSSAGGYGSAGLNANGGLGLSGRAALTPVTGFTVGLSAARGAFLSAGASPYGSWHIGGYDPAEYPQTIAGIDVEFAAGHFTLNAEGFLNRWDFRRSRGDHLEAAGFSVEARYVPAARFFLAARAGGITFNEPDDGGWGDDGYFDDGAGFRSDPDGSGRSGARLRRTAPAHDGPAFPHPSSDYHGGGGGRAWDLAVVRYEGSVGYRISRRLLLKAVYQHVNTVGLGRDPHDDTAALQIVAAF